MISNYIVSGLFTAFIAFHFLTQRSASKERQRLVDAVIAKNSQEFLNIQKHVAPVKEVERREPERIYAEGF